MSRLLGSSALAIALLGFARWSVAAPIVFLATLNGASESPPVVSPGTGSAEVDLDLTAQTLHVHVVFSGLTSGTTASHIHAPTALPFQGATGVATTTPTFVGFPLGVTSGTFDSTLDLTSASSYNPAFVTANGGTVASAEAVLVSSIMNGFAYLNIHTTQNPGGEISGFLVAAVPEPASLAMGATAALAGLGAWWYRRRRAAA